MVGTAVLSDTADLTNGSSPTGTVTFTLTAPDRSTSSETVAVSGNGYYTTPTAVTATEVGTYVWSASYGGDANNQSATEPDTTQELANESVTTVSASPMIVTAASETASGVVGSSELSVRRRCRAATT